MYKKYFADKKAIFFDLDGTITPSEGLWYEAFSKILTSIGYSWVTPKLTPGNPISSQWDYLMAEGDIQTKLTIKELTSATQNAFLQLLPTSTLAVFEGFWEFIAELKDRNYKLALTTNTEQAIAEKIITHLSLGAVFDLALYGDQVKNKKPSPEIYQTAAKQLGLAPKEVLVFEDSVTGAEASVAAGMQTVVIWDGNVSQRYYPEKILEFMPDFTPFLGNMDRTFDEIVAKAKEKRLAKQSKAVTLPQA